ncbi:type 2 isopentenyl-diphosphate Delta-isomerase [Thiomicrorhabdus sp.]|uniref:type 2 isopentenyl-diphosphate Delta-isomerase n=1 Tax=Thiomicrorhabdus sp. TaxID=2039724 RepID=UPI0029C6C163|nr:type 2 isopentenyl-diphosphate Delta-isomerase [Thiomicrorhabdus sp.]
MTRPVSPQETLLLNQRKQDHIQAVLEDPKVDRNQAAFDSLRLMHRAMPECNLADLKTSSCFLGKPIAFPFLIASMTGGAADNLSQINRNLAEAAEACQIPMAVGSQRAMIQDTNARKSFQLRSYAPTVPLIANLGAVQLNYGFGIDEAQRAVEALQADALYLHLNPLQEVIQPEGDTDFSALMEKIHRLNEKLDIPIILKEVGCGLSPQDIELGLQAGIRYFDLAGRGGTSWSRIEAHRSNDDLGFLFEDWGLTTLEALQLSAPYQSQATFIASGGIRNGIDMVKAVIMGGRLCGIAAPLLSAAMNSSAEVIEIIRRFEREFRTAQFLLGIKSAEDLHLNTSLILPKTAF